MNISDRLTHIEKQLFETDKYLNSNYSGDAFGIYEAVSYITNPIERRLTLLEKLLFETEKYVNPTFTPTDISDITSSSKSNHEKRLMILERYLFQSDKYLNPLSEWDYEGIMTVGGDAIAQGYESTNCFLGATGSMTPPFTYTNDTGCNFLAYEYEGFFEVTAIVAILKIDNIEFIPNSIDHGSSYFSTPESTPFPAVGETCSIKIKLAS